MPPAPQEGDDALDIYEGPSAYGGREAHGDPSSALASTIENSISVTVDNSCSVEGLDNGC